MCRTAGCNSCVCILFWCVQKGPHASTLLFPSTVNTLSVCMKSRRRSRFLVHLVVPLGSCAWPVGWSVARPTAWPAAAARPTNCGLVIQERAEVPCWTVKAGEMSNWRCEGRTRSQRFAKKTSKSKQCTQSGRAGAGSQANDMATTKGGQLRVHESAAIVAQICSFLVSF